MFSILAAAALGLSSPAPPTIDNIPFEMALELCAKSYQEVRETGQMVKMKPVFDAMSPDLRKNMGILCMAYAVGYNDGANDEDKAE